MKKRPNISDAEWQVMQIVWEKAPVPASDIVERLQRKKHWHARTTRTLIDRLVRKRALRIEREGKRYLFWPRISKEECLQKESTSLLERVFGEEPGAMLIHLVKQATFTPGEIQELQRILEEKQE